MSPVQGMGNVHYGTQHYTTSLYTGADGDISATRLRSGHGAEACAVLQALATRALAAGKQFQYQEPVYPTEEVAQQEVSVVKCSAVEWRVE